MAYRGGPQSSPSNASTSAKDGQSGYLTPTVSGIPTASERGAKSEVAHKWAKWLPHPCRIGDPHRFESGGQNQKWPTSRQNGYLTPAVLRIPTASERGAKSEVAHKWAKWLPHPCRIGDPHRFRAWGQNQKWPTSGQNGYLTPAVSGIPTASERGGKIRNGPQVGKVATSPLPYRGSPPLQSGGQNEKWPTSGQNGYLTPAVLGIPTASERGAKSEMAHKWAKWLPHPCRIGDPHRFRAWGQNQKWPTSGQNGYLTPAVLGIPTASKRGAESEVAHKWAKWLPHPCRIGDPHRFRAWGQNEKWPTSGQNGHLTPAVSGIPTASERGAKSEVAHKWAKWLPHACRIGDPHRFRAGGQNQKWPTSGQNGYLTPAILGIPTASERGGKMRNGPQVGKMATSPLPYRGSPPLQSVGAKSEVAHKWANWLPHPCRIGDPHRFRAGGKIRSGPQVGKMATSPLPYWGSPPLQSGGAKSEVAHKWAKWLPHPCRIGDPHRFRAWGQNQKWPTSGQNGYLTPAVLGIPTASERGAKSEMAHKWAKWLPHPCRIGGSHRFRAGGKIRSGPQVGKVATSPLPYRGSPPLQSGGQNQKWPTSGQNGYLTLAVSGIPTASQRGGKIRNGPQAGKMATSPLPYWGSPPLQSGGQNQKWPTSGQSGYLTPAVSGIPTASERGAKSEVAHKWAKWLPHPCRIGDPHRFRAWEQNQKWPTNGQNGYLTPAVLGIPTASERGARSEVAHKWAKWLPHPCRIGDPHRFRAGGKIRSGPQVGKMATSPLPYRGSPPLQSGGQNQKWPTSGQNGYLTPAVLGIPTASERGGKIRNGPQVGKMATSPLPYWGSPPLQSGGQNQKWPTSGQSGYLTPAVLGIPTASERGGKIRSGPQVGKMATSPLPYRGSPPLQSGGQNQKWPTSGQNGYLTPAVSGIPTASERGAKSEVAHNWAKWLPHPCRIGDPHRFRAGGQNQKWPTSGQNGYLTPAVSGIPTASERGAESEVAHKWAKWLPHPCRIGDPHRFRAWGQNEKWPTNGQNGYLTPAVSGIPTASERGGKIRSGPQVGKMATSPLPYRGSPPLQSGGQNQKWPTSGQNGYLTPAVLGIPTASERGGKMRNGPQVGKMATSPLPYRGSPPLQSGGQNEKWPTSGQNGYLTPAVLGIPTASERGAKSEMAHKWAKWLPHPCRIGDPHRFRAGGKIRSGPQVGKMATSPLPYRGSPPLQSGGQNQKWPTSGQNGYLTPAVSGIPTASERGAKSEVAHNWAKWLPHPCRIGDPHRFRAGGQNQKWPTSGQSGYLTPAVSGIPTASERGAKSEVAHKWAKWLPHPCRIGDPHRFRAGGQNQKWPTSGQNGYLTPAVLGIPTASERGGKMRNGPQVGKMATSPLPYRGSPPLQSGGARSEMAHKWAKWLPHHCRIGDPHRFRAGGKIRSGPQVGKMATSPLPYRGSPPLQSGGQNQKWPTSGQNGYLTPAVSGIPTASERGAKSEMANKWAKWLPHPCRIGDPHRFRAWEQNQKWPTNGQNGYLTPAVLGIPTASERGARSEVAHKWAKWLPHPCRIGDPHRFRAGGKIRSGPQVGKMATSPLPYRGSPPLQSGGQNQKWPTSGQNGYLTPAVLGIPTASERGGKIRNGPQVGKMATSPLPYWGSPPLQSGGQNQKWPTSGQSGYLTPAVLGIPTASERGGKIRSGPQVGKMATSPLPYRGSPPLQSGGQNQKWPTSGQNGYLTPAVSGIPTASERGAKSEVAHNWAKWLPHPCRIGDPHRFRAGGQNQKWPTSGQNGYLTPAVSGIPTASERGAESEVAHKWAKWLPHPCRIGDPHRFRAWGQNEKWPTNGQNGYLTPAVLGIPTASERGGKMRSGPQMGKMATSPLPYRGSPPLQSGGAKSEVAHKWAKWLPHPCRIGDPHRFRAGGQNQKWPTSGQNGYLTPAVLGIPTASERGGKMRNGPQVGKMATSPVPYRGSPPLQSGGQNQKWPTSGQNGYLTPAVSGIPTASERGAKSEMANKWAKWLPHPCRIRDPHRFRAGGKIRSGPQLGKMATSPLPYRGSPPLQSGGAKSEVAHKWAKWLPHPCRIGDPHRFRAGGKIRSGPQVGKMATSPLPYRGSPPLQSGGAKSEVAHKWAKWLPHPCRIGDPHRFRAWGQNEKWPTSGQNGYLTPAVSGIPTASERGGKIRNGPQVGKMATSPLPYRGSPPLQSGGQNQKWPTSGQNGYLTPAVSGIPTASERGAKSEVAHKWAKWLPHPCRIGDPHRFRAGGKIRNGQQVGKMATSPLPYRGSPPLQSGGQNQKWPTSGQNGYLTPAVSGVPTASERGAKSEVAHKWAKWLPHPCRIGDPHRFRAWGQNEKWPTSGQNGYLTPAVSGIPTASERGGKIRSGPQVGKMATSPLPYRGSPPLQSGGAKSEVAHKWAKWLPHPCRIGDPHRFRAGGKIRSGPQVGKMATSPLPYRGSPPLQSGGAKSEVAHKWAKWLPHPCRIGDPHRFRAWGQNQKWPTSGQNGYLTPAVLGIPTASERGGKIRNGPQVGKMATSPLPYRGFPPLQSGGQNQKWPTSGQSGYLTPAVSGIPTASERGAKSEVAHKWAKWLPHPCRIGGSHRFRAGGKIRSGPQVGKMATSPLPYWGSPPLQSVGAK